MPNDKTRLKTTVRDNREQLVGLSPNMTAFYNELITRYPDLRVTDGKRTPQEKVGKAYKTSHHNTGDAIDIGREHSNIYSDLMNTREGLTLLNKYGLGIIDETNPEILASTQGTAEHFHIGPDSKYVAEAQKRLENFDKITPVQSYISNPKAVNYYAPKYEPTGATFVPIQVDNGVVQQVPISTSMLKREIEKEKVKEVDVAKDPEKQKIEQAIEKKKQFLANFKSNFDVKPAQQVDQQPTDFSQYEGQKLPVQNSMPELPSIFQFKDGGSKTGPENNSGPRAAAEANFLDAISRARMATAAELGNTAVKRMVNPYPQTYSFTGNEGEGVPQGEIGTHYMSSMDNFAVPFIQQDVNGNLFFSPTASPDDPEAIRFNSPEEAQYFAENYKRFAPMSHNAQQ